MISVLLSSFAIIFFAELPDKTALASLVLATRYEARDVVAGAWLAFVIHTAIAVAAGSVLQLLPAKPVRVAAGIGFLVFAVLALRRDEDEEIAAEAEDVSQARRWHQAPWLISFAIVFAAEWGDLTQFAIAALVANTRRPIEVFFGSLAGLWLVALLAAAAGSQMSRFLTPALLQKVSAVLFALVGVIVVATALL